MKRLIIGIGNDLLSDDGLGIYIVEQLKSENFEAVTLCSADSGFGLLDHMLGYDHVILIDSIITGKGKVGSVYQFSATDFNNHIPFSIHTTDIVSLLAYLKKGGLHVPGKVHFLAVEIVDNQTFNEGFSTLVEARKNDIVREVKMRLRRIIKTGPGNNSGQNQVEEAK